MLAYLVLGLAALPSTPLAISSNAPSPEHQLLPRQCAGTLCAWGGSLCCLADTVCSTDAQNKAVCVPRDTSVASLSMSTFGVNPVSSLASSALRQITTTTKKKMSSMDVRSVKVEMSVSGSGSGSVETIKGTGTVSTMPLPKPSTGGCGSVKGWGGVVAVVAA